MMERDFREEMIKILTEYVESELEINEIELQPDTAQEDIATAVTDAVDSAIDSADDFVNEMVALASGATNDQDDPWDTGNEAPVYDRMNAVNSARDAYNVTYTGQSGRNGYVHRESGVSGGQAHDSDRWKDAWGND